jgi:hypothetical protein
MARFTPVIEPLSLLSTDPVVLRARVETPVGAIAAVTFIFPEFVPFNAPIRSVPADTWFSSVLVRDRRSETSVPRSITVLLEYGAIVTTPLADVVPMVAPRESVFAVIETTLEAMMLLSTVTEGLTIPTALVAEIAPPTLALVALIVTAPAEVMSPS